MADQGLGALLGHDLVAQVQAFGALAHAGEPPCQALPTELADRRPVGGDDHPGDVLPPFAAEAASRLGFAFGSQSSPPVGAHFVFGNHLVSEVDAPLADEHARAGDQPADLSLGGSAEAARPVGLTFLHGPLPGSGVHDLMDPLVAQAERLGDLPKGCTGPMEAPDGVLVPDLGLIGLVLEVERTVTRLARLPNEFPVEGHVSTMIDDKNRKWPCRTGTRYSCPS